MNEVVTQGLGRELAAAPSDVVHEAAQRRPVQIPLGLI